MGRRKALLPLSLLLSALSEIAGILPFVLVWMIIRELMSGDGLPDSVTSLAWWSTGMAVAGVILYFAALMASHLAAFRVESGIRKKTMRRVMAKPLGFFERNTCGKMRKIIDDNASVTHSFIAHQLPDLAGAVLVPVLGLSMIFLSDWRMGLVCLVPVVAAMLVMGFSMGSKGRHFMKSYMDALEDMNTEAVEYVRGIPVLKVFQQSIYSFKNFHASIMEYNRMVTGYTEMWEKPMSAYTVIINSFVFILGPLALLMVRNGEEPSVVLADFLLFALVTPVFSQCIMKIMYMDQAFGQAREAVRRLDSLVDYPVLSIPSSPRRPEQYDVVYSHVSFTYPGTGRKAVDDVSFSVPQGTKTALVGVSGGGKTTLAKLLPRFWDVDGGSITIGGVNVRDIAPDELTRDVSFVFQNTRLFKTTLLENIMYGNPSASMADVERAVCMARCRDIVDRLPLGLKTRIGAGGTYLSGGEQQRIALARAILKNTPVVVLDEATAFADPENEHLIQQALRELMKDKTVLMIAHRLPGVTDADEILVVGDGRILERGTHQSLLAGQGVYAGMWNEYLRSVDWKIRRSAGDKGK